MLSDLVLGASETILWVIPRWLWFSVLVVLCVILIVMYIKYRKSIDAVRVTNGMIEGCLKV
jgi:hypothetical protein